MRLIDDPEALRLRGKQMRERADKAVLTEVKKAFARIANDCEMLAQRAEQRLGALAKRDNSAKGAA
jgi:hypothetical protein